MKNNPPLPSEATPRHCYKYKKMQTTESHASRATTSGPLPKIDPLKSYFPVSPELDITSPLASESDTIETEAPEISLPKVIELDYIESKMTQPEVIQPETPQLSTPIIFAPLSSLSLSQTQPQHVYLGISSTI